MTHLPDCGYHMDQYWWECTCGALPTYCKVCGTCEQGPEAGMICRNPGCPRKRPSSASETEVPEDTKTGAANPLPQSQKRASPDVKVYGNDE